MGNPSGEDVAYRSGVRRGRHPRRFRLFGWWRVHVERVDERDLGGVTAEKVDAIANTVPEAIKSSGKLIVGVNIPYAPNEFKDPSGKIVGFDVDLVNAVAATLGLTPEYREADFAKIIPSIQGDTFNIGMSSFTDTKEREQTVDFVTYFSAGILWAQRPGDTDRPEQRVR